MFTHKQQKKKYKQNDPMLTVQFYQHSNTDIYWQIFAASVVLGSRVDSIKLNSSGPRFDTWVSVLLQDCKTFCSKSRTRPAAARPAAR
jgi:hypothetical protein